MPNPITQPVSHAQAAVVSLAGTIIGFVVAFVPSWAPEKSKLIATATIVIAAVYMVVNLGHALLATKAPPPGLDGPGVRTIVHDVLDHADFTAIVHSVVNARGVPGLGELVGAELARILSAASRPPEPAPPVPPADPNAPAAA